MGHGHLSRSESSFSTIRHEESFAVLLPTPVGKNEILGQP
jgi:hypothetical protein